MNDLYDWLITKQPSANHLRESSRSWGIFGTILLALGAVPFLLMLVLASGAKRDGGTLFAIMQQIPFWLPVAASIVMSIGIFMTVYAFALREASTRARNVHRL